MEAKDGHTCDSPVTVTVGGTGIPVIDDGVTIYERKDGHMSINRRADVHFPLVTDEAEWVNEIDAFRDGGEIQVADVAMRGLGDNAEEKHILRGYINGVGSRGGMNVGRFRVLGPFKLLSSIPAGGTVFGGGDLNNTLLNWFADRFESGQPIFDSVSINSSFDSNSTLSESINTASNDRLISLSANRDTLADGVNQMINKLGIFLTFSPDPENRAGIIMNAHPITDMPSKNFDATPGGDLTVIENDALYEMRPFNGIDVKGKSGAYIDADVGSGYENLDISSRFGDGTYPEAEAIYPPLVERAGGKIKQTVNSKARSAADVERQARTRLKQMLDEVSGGSMLTEIEPSASLYDTITATPACADIFDEETPELRYEVQRIEHTVAPSNANNNVPTTKFSVSMDIDPSKIEVESTRKTTQPSKDSENEPPDSDPSSNANWGWS